MTHSNAIARVAGLRPNRPRIRSDGDGVIPSETGRKPIIRARPRRSAGSPDHTVQLVALGLNHQTAPLALRERVAFVPDEVGAVIAHLRDRLSARDAGQVSEAAIVSTCNRTELYCAAEEPNAAGIALAEFVATTKHLDSGELRKASYVLPQSNAVRHAFRVASGLESMVIGEPQILGQMKQAERLARQAGGMGPAPSVPADFRSREGSSQLDGNRHAIGFHGRRRGARRRTDFWRADRIACAVCRRR